MAAGIPAAIFFYHRFTEVGNEMKVDLYRPMSIFKGLLGLGFGIETIKVKFIFSYECDGESAYS